MEIRLTRAALIGYLALAVLGGLAIGVGLLVWQRVVLQDQVTAAQQRLVESRKGALGTQGQITGLQIRLKSAETSIAMLTKENSRLASDLVVAQGSQAGGTKSGGSTSSSSGKITFLSRSVSPNTIQAGKPMTLTVKLKGSPDHVRMRVVARDPSISYEKTFALAKVGSSGGTQTWKATVNAPGDLGEYRYYASATVGSKKYEMAGVSAWLFQVE